MNRNLIFIALALFTWGIGEGMFANFQPIYLMQLGSDPQQIGVILSLFGAAMAVTHIPAGYLADKFGRRPLLVAAWAMGFVSALTMALATTLPWFVTGMLIYGLTAFVSSPLSSYVTAARGEWTIGQTLTLTSGMFNLGMALGPLASGWIGERYGLRSTYYIVTVLFAASTVIMYQIQDQPIEHHDSSASRFSILSNARFVLFLGVMGFAVFSMYLAQPLTPNYITETRGLSLTDAGFIFTAGALGNALLTISLGRFNPRLSYPIAQALVGFFVLCLWKGAGLGWFAAGYFLLGGFRAARPLASAQARELVRESQMGLTFGVMETVNAIIFILTPTLAGFLFTQNPSLPYPLSLGLIAVSIVATLILLPRVFSHKDEPHA
ncbi:MAG: Multidrug resistance protein MdtG [Anaerolineales bacterium]|nr:Multidrug resistance protein MdtG [Anaerolineales bacterium]